MGRAPCCDKANVKKGPWSPEEDERLKSYIEEHGTGGNWIALPQKIGLKRCGKSCRLRWLNYLRPNIKHGGFSDDEDSIICSLYIAIGSRWSIIAAHLPGRTDNDIKNHWNTKLKTRLLGKQRKNQRINPPPSNLKQPIKMNSKPNNNNNNNQSASVTNCEANIKPWPLNHEPSTDHHASADYNQSQVSISNYKSQMKLADAMFPCCGNGPHQIQVAPSLRIPEAIYGAPANTSTVNDDGSPLRNVGPQILEQGFMSYSDNNSSLMNSKLEAFDFFYGMSSLMSDDQRIAISESFIWSEMNSLGFPLPLASSYDEIMHIGKQ